MLKYFCLLFVVFITFAIKSFAETNEPIYTDRPGQSTNPHTVGTGNIQLQSGFKYGIEDIIDIYSMNNIIRYGIFDEFEIQAGFGLIYFESEEHRNIDFSDLLFGVRYNILKKDGYIPGIGVQSRYLLSSIFNEFTTDKFEFLLTYDQKVVGDLSTGFNLISTNETNLDNSFYGYTIYTSYSFEKVNILLELFGNNELQKNYEPNTDVGISYQFDDSLIIDITLGDYYDHSEFRASSYFVELGLTYRLMPD